MKKLVGVLVVAAGAYLALTYYGGYAGEQAFVQQIEQSAAQGELHGYEVEVVSYERGFLSSHTVMNVRFDLAYLGLDELQMTSTTQIKHGPILINRKGIQLGLFAAHSDVEFAASNDELGQLLTELLPEGLDEVLMIGHFNQTYSAYMDVPEVDQDLAEGRLTLDGGQLVIKGGYDGRDAQGQLTLGALHFNDGDSATFMLSPSALDFDIQMLDDLVNSEGEFSYAADSLTLSVAGAPEVVLADVGVEVVQELVNERLDSNFAFTIGEVRGSPIETRNFVYELGLKQVSPAAVVAWRALARDLQQYNMDEVGFSAHQAELMEVLELLLQEGLALSVRLAADILDGDADVNLQANYVGLPDNRGLSEVVDAMDYFAMADADLEVKLSESVLMQTPLYFMAAQYLDAYFEQEGEHLVMRASLRGGQLSVADQLFPLAFLLGG